jgi:hypothetical protein
MYQKGVTPVIGKILGKRSDWSSLGQFHVKTVAKGKSIGIW